MKRSKIICVVAAAVAVLCVALIAIGCLTVEKVIRTELLKALPEKSTIEKVSFHPFSCALEIVNLQIPNPAGYPPRQAFVMERALADLNLWALTRHVIYFEKLHIGPVKVNVELKKIPTSFSDIINMAWTRSDVNLLDMLPKENSPKPRAERSSGTSRSAKSEPWKMRIDSLVIGPTEVSCGNIISAAQLSGSAFKAFQDMLPAKVKENKTMYNSAVAAFRATIVPYVEQKLAAWQNSCITLPEYSQKNLGKNEDATVQDVAVEIAQRHWTESKIACEEKIYKGCKALQLQWEKLKKQIDKLSEQTSRLKKIWNGLRKKEKQ